MRFAPVACSNDDICRLINIQNTVLKCYPQVTISCETVDIEKTVNHNNSLYRDYHEELDSVRHAQGVYIVYTTPKVNHCAVCEDILFIGHTSFGSSSKYFYDYGHEGYIPKVLEFPQPFNVFYRLYQERGLSYSLRLDEFMNQCSFLCITINSDFDDDVRDASLCLFERLQTVLIYDCGYTIKTIYDILGVSHEINMY